MLLFLKSSSTVSQSLIFTNLLTTKEHSWMKDRITEENHLLASEVFDSVDPGVVDGCVLKVTNTVVAGFHLQEQFAAA